MCSTIMLPLEFLAEIVEILWSDADIEHIARHGVSPDEVEEVVALRPVWRRGRRHPVTGRKSLYALGQTEAGRFLFVVLSPRGRSRARCITAMDMDSATRAFYMRHRR